MEKFKVFTLKEAIVHRLEKIAHLPFCLRDPSKLGYLQDDLRFSPSFLSGCLEYTEKDEINSLLYAEIESFIILLNDFMWKSPFPQNGREYERFFSNREWVDIQQKAKALAARIAQT